MFLTEQAQKWGQIIKEDLGVTNTSKLSWMQEYAANHEVYEGLQSSGPIDGGIYATPLNTIGMGNPAMPTGLGNPGNIGNTGADFHNKAYGVGSGDQLPMSTISMALNVAAMAIGLELVPVIVSPGPWYMLSYMDFPYAGGKLGRVNETALDGKGAGVANKPIYIKINADRVSLVAAHTSLVKGTDYTFLATVLDDATPVTKGELKGRYLGKSRVDNNIIVEIRSVKTADAAAALVDDSINNFFSVARGEGVTLSVFDKAGTTAVAVSETADLVLGGYLTSDFVATATDHVEEFSNFATGSKDPMTRAENETGVGNTIGARMFTKMIQMGSYEVTGTVTRQQLQDLPLYGVDVIGKVLEQMQNDISQTISKRIVDRLFSLGVTNASLQKDYQGLDLNLLLGDAATATKALKDFDCVAKYGFKDIHGVDVSTAWGSVKSAINNTSAENVITHQRRVSSRCLAAANVITQVGRRGRANFIVTNAQVLSALQDSANFVIAPMVNTLTQDGSTSLYFAGSVAGLNIYVDPYMAWDDTRVLVGRKGGDNDPGVKFMPYILADTVQTIVEGTMAPKLLVNSRFAIADAGFNPEFNYLVFAIQSEVGGLI